MDHDQHQHDRQRFPGPRQPTGDLARFRAQLARLLRDGAIPHLTPQQHVTLWTLAQAQGLDPDAGDWWCRVIAGVVVEQLTEDQVAIVIAALHEERQEA